MDRGDELTEQRPARPEGIDDASYIRILERQNEALRVANAKLARERLGSSDAAAATKLALGGSAVGSSSFSDRLLAPLRALRLWIRRIVLRALR